MRDIYMEDEDYFRLIEFMIAGPTATILGDYRDALMIALGDKAGIWPESSRR